VEQVVLLQFLEVVVVEQDTEVMAQTATIQILALQLAVDKVLEDSF
jgi:hypothetical protein